MLIYTQWTPLRKARTLNETASSFGARIPMATEPPVDAGTATGQATINMRNGGGLMSSRLMVIPYGVGTNDQTFSFRVLGWRRFGEERDVDMIWIGPILLVEANCIIDDTLVGLALKKILATEIFCDTITLQGTSGVANISHELVSPADGITIAHAMVDTKGCDRVEVQFKVGTATSANALIAMTSKP